MTNFKNHKNAAGFTLIEVVIAIALVAFVTVALLNLQGGLLKNTYRARDALRRIMLLVTFLHDQHKLILEGKEPVKEKSIDEPVTRFKYAAKRPAQGSPLGKIEDLVIEQVTAEWTDRGQKRSEDLVYLRAKRPQSTGSEG